MGGRELRHAWRGHMPEATSRLRCTTSHKSTGGGVEARATAVSKPGRRRRRESLRRIGTSRSGGSGPLSSSTPAGTRVHGLPGGRSSVAPSCRHGNAASQGEGAGVPRRSRRSGRQSRCPSPGDVVPDVWGRAGRAWRTIGRNAPCCAGGRGGGHHKREPKDNSGGGAERAREERQKCHDREDHVVAVLMPWAARTRACLAASRAKLWASRFRSRGMRIQ